MRWLWVLCVAAILSGCYDSSFDERGADTEEPPATITLLQLRELYAGVTFRIDAEVVVKGTVSTSDRDENFFRSFCIEDNGAALEVMAGIDHLHNDYPLGARVTLKLKGLALGESRGVLQAGRMPEPGSGYATDYIGSQAALGRYLLRSPVEPQPIAPAIRTIGELKPTMCGTLIRIEHLRYTPEDLTDGTWSGYKRFTDPAGGEIRTYVRPYARFAEMSVPAESVAIVGILQLDGTRYILKLRDEGDCSH